MHRESLLNLLEQLRTGDVSIEQAADSLTHLPFEDTGFAKIDHHRALRTGLPEVIYAQGKTPAQTGAIFERLAHSGVNVLATKADGTHFEAVQTLVPAAEYHALARCITLRQTEQKPHGGTIAVVCAGTSDLPIAEEAAITAELFGATVLRITDVGVAGIHRLLAQRPLLNTADVVIACAGMEGALPSVLGGMVGVPVIAVPTSVGYGVSFNGITALLSMLNSCSPNTTVVNIDNGFGAAYTATLVCKGQQKKGG
ncbi:nickel pincer cofactor biosynthesis protein LarB [Terriglobus tenax]|uniref:nickel pincer cofactor biosynthesis protein LarB n=1 Tax=Terriglobus tenax TaxID=1111115 RepID=UPI0021DF6A50|nr:nickel pincer cofactor biosynthesis protein LarB [Terriglobus tenax]